MARPRTFDEAEVLAKARDAFWLRGYTATSISDLEAVTGLTRTSLYAAFGGKHDLFCRVLRDYRAEYAGHLQEISASATDFQQASRRLLALAEIAARTDRAAGRPCRGCLVANATVELAPVDARVAEFVAENRAAFAAALRPLAEADDALKLTPEVACDYVYAVYTGLNALAKSGASGAELEAVADGACAVLA